MEVPVTTPLSPRPNFARARATALALADGDHRQAGRWLAAAYELVANDTSQRIRDELLALYLKEGDRG